MTASLDLTPNTIDRIRHDLAGLKMPRALEALDQIIRRLEHGEISALEAIDTLLSEELTLRENSRIKIALRMGRLTTIKTLAGFDFSFQPSLDRDRILTLAQLGFIARCEVIHLLGPPGTGKSHLATALGVEAVKATKRLLLYPGRPDRHFGASRKRGPPSGTHPLLLPPRAPCR
jgi:DNA replication protein DnaC